MRSLDGMVGGGSSIAGRIVGSGGSISTGEPCSSEADEEKEGGLAGADLRRGVAALVGFDVGRGGLKAADLRFGAAFESPDGITLKRSGPLSLLSSNFSQDS